MAAEFKHPSWADPAYEAEPTYEARYSQPGFVTVSSEGKRRATILLQHVFVWDFIRMAQKLGCDEEQAIHFVANSYVECAAGAAIRGKNIQGVKANANNIKGRQFFRAPGHVKSGDAEWVLYLIFPTVEESMRFGINRYAPKPKPGDQWDDTMCKTADYRAAGLCFHRVAGRPIRQWFPFLIDAEYKGDLTKNIPERRAQSIATFMSLVDTVRTIYRRPFCGSPLSTQTILAHLGYYKGKLDGEIGPQSREAIEAAQRAEGLPQTGAMDAMLGDALLRRLLKTLPALT